MKKFFLVINAFLMVGCYVDGPRMHPTPDPNITCTYLTGFNTETGSIVVVDMLDKKTGMHYLIFHGTKSVAVYPRIGMDIPEEKR